MTLKLNRQTFLTLLGATTAGVAMARPARFGITADAMPTGTPRCFMNSGIYRIPARPRTAAITYLCE